MQCIFLLPDAGGRLPSAQELRAAGFRVSEAVEESPRHDALARAAEPRAPYPAAQAAARARADDGEGP